MTIRKNKIFNPLSMLVAGLVLGAVSRFLDIYTQVLGDIFSQMAIWIFIGTLISVYSETKKKAMLNILPFCLGMLFTYYLVAVITKGVYSKTFIIGWTAFAFCSPIMAYFAWMTKERGVFPKIISVGILLVSVLSGIVLFGGPRGYDFIINGALAYFLFFAKVRRHAL